MSADGNSGTDGMTAGTMVSSGSPLMVQRASGQRRHETAPTITRRCRWPTSRINPRTAIRGAHRMPGCHHRPGMRYLRQIAPAGQGQIRCAFRRSAPRTFSTAISGAAGTVLGRAGPRRRSFPPAGMTAGSSITSRTSHAPRTCRPCCNPITAGASLASATASVLPSSCNPTAESGPPGPKKAVRG